jgi:tetratricopeptide (TPR) repeat protein
MAGIVLVVSLLTYFLTPKALPENPRCDVVIARLMEDTANLIAAKRLRKAERNIAELKVLLPDNSTVHTFVGAAKSLEKDYAGARAEYARALELNPNSFNAAFNLAEVDFVTKKLSPGGGAIPRDARRPAR